MGLFGGPSADKVIERGSPSTAVVVGIDVRYVSDDTSWGLDLALWPRSFTRYVELELAWRISERLTQNASKKELIGRDRDRAKRNALNKDALNEAQPKFPPMSSWTAARGGAASRERGNRGRLVG